MTVIGDELVNWASSATDIALPSLRFARSAAQYAGWHKCMTRLPGKLTSFAGDKPNHTVCCGDDHNIVSLQNSFLDILRSSAFPMERTADSIVATPLRFARLRIYVLKNGSSDEPRARCTGFPSCDVEPFLDIFADRNRYLHRLALRRGLLYRLKIIALPCSPSVTSEQSSPGYEQSLTSPRRAKWTNGFAQEAHH